MFFLGAEIQRDEHGRCALLSQRTFPFQTSALQALHECILTRALTLIGTASHEKRTCAIVAWERGLCQESIGES